MPISDVINPHCYRNFSQACLLNVPDWFVRYAALHLDTIPKFLNHVLIIMALCNSLCVLCAWTISLLSFFAAFLLGFQNACVLLILNNGKLVFAPRFLAPTEFMIGVSLGISVGGTILAFFLCLTYGKFHAFCEHAKGEYSCGQYTGAINGVWWWSSVVFWLNMLTCLLIAAGRHDIASQASRISQYESIDDNGMSMDQYEDHFQRFKETQLQRQRDEMGSFVGNFSTDIPGMQPPSSSASSPTQKYQEQYSQQQYTQSSSNTPHQGSQTRYTEDPLTV